MFNLNYLNYLLHKPFHSYKYKVLKKRSASLAQKSNLYEKVLKEISAYTKEDVSIIGERCKDLLASVNERDYDSLSEDKLLEFYANTEHYIYELPIWNTGHGRNICLAWILTPYFRRNRYRDILDFGAGSGDLCIALAENGFNVYYTDVNKRLIEFSKWRFQKHKLDIKIIDGKELNTKEFDCVVSFDVFEHFKNLPVKITDMHTYIKRGGSLVFNIELSGDGLHLEENKIYNDDRKLDEVMKKAGFVFNWKFKRFFFYKKR